MYYLIQKNVFQDPRYDRIFEVMEELGLEYESVEFKPRSIEFDMKTDRKDIFVYGSVKLAKVTADFDWTPGSFYGHNHEFEHYAKGYGEHTINYGSYICTLGDSIDWATHRQLFIKPAKDAKVFTGKVFNEHEWKDFVYEKLHEAEHARVSESTLIQVSKPYAIFKEARVWIVGKKVVTSSYYRFHGDVEFEEHVAAEGLAFAQRMADLYNVADAYVMDIAMTMDGWKIMEVNCINSAGFYKGDVKRIVLALEDFFGR
ncbi:MAG: ATP-grasp domain-containing protein [Bacteroidia bacterium]